MGFWDWVAPSSSWYALRVREHYDPMSGGYTREHWEGPSWFTRRQANNWQTSISAYYRDGITELYQWTGYSWQKS